MVKMVSWLLVAHVFGFVFWISGLVGAAVTLSHLVAEPSAEGREALARVQRIALRAFADPGALLTIVAGVMLITTNSGYYLHARWLHIKLAFVLILIVLHGVMAMRGKAAATAGAGANSGGAGQIQMLLLFILLVFLSILIATLPGSVFLG
jgi:putative membrane protein